MTLSVIVNGVEYSLDDGIYCYWTGDDGLGMAPMHRLDERGPLQHGDSDRGYRLDPRIVRLILDIIATTRVAMFSKRASLLSIFKPTEAPITIKLELDDGDYCLDCHYISQMEMSSKDRIGWNQTVVVELKANDPTWYDPVAADLSFSLGGGADTMLVPTVIPMTVGGSTIDVSTPINYAGDFASYPLIRITGPITNCVITNDSTGEKLDFTGTTIAASDYYDIDCRYGYKTVKDSNGVDVVSDLTADSDLATFHIGAAPEVGGGVNSISVSGSSVTATTAIAMAYFTRFIGR